MYIDLETTGVNPKMNGICQIGGIIVANGQTEEFNWYMNPGDVRIEPAAMGLNGITVEKMKASPSSEDRYEQFQKLAGKYVNKYDPKDKFYFIGYNNDFDMNFMRSWFEHHQDQYLGSWFYYPPLDVMQVAAFKLMGERGNLQNLKLSTVYEYVLKKPLMHGHDAINDIRATKELLSALTAQYGLF